MLRKNGKALFIMAGAGLLLAASAGAGFAIGGPGGGGGGNGGGAEPPRNYGRFCEGPDCYYPEHHRPRPRLTGDNCCWQRVKKMRIRIDGKMRTVYLDKGRKCVKVTSMQQCVKFSRNR